MRLYENGEFSYHLIVTFEDTSDVFHVLGRLIVYLWE